MLQDKDIFMSSSLSFKCRFRASVHVRNSTQLSRCGADVFIKMLIKLHIITAPSALTSKLFSRLVTDDIKQKILIKQHRVFFNV